jgi:ATP-dependent DNA helicase RecG
VDTLKSAKEILEVLRTLGETERIEAKLCGAVSDSVMQTVCAFANEPGLGGGQLLLGVDEQRELLVPTYPIAGIKNVDKITNDLLSQCRSRFNVAVSPRINPEKVEGKTVLNVYIPEMASGSKPVYFREEGLPRGAFRRSSSGDVHCTDDDLLALFEGRGSQSYDSSIVPNASWNDVDPNVIEEYRRERAKSAPESDELSLSDQELLYSMGCLEESERGYTPTVAGLLLFGKKAAIRRVFPLMRVDYIQVPGKEWVADPGEEFESLDLLDPLMRTVKRGLAAVLQDFSSSSVLPDGEAQRQATQTMPGRALREAIVNAVMHRSYRIQSAVQIIRYSNRIEIRNPGYSLKNEERWGETRSINRNPKIASVMYDGRFAETKGRGMRVMQKAMEDAGLTPPLFESDRADDSFVVTFLLHHFLSTEDLDWLAGFKQCQLSDEEAKALIWVRETGGTEGAINIAIYRNLNQVDATNAAEHLRRLQAMDVLIKKRGRGIQSYYKPGKIFIDVHSRWESERLNRGGMRLTHKDSVPLQEGLGERLFPNGRGLEERLDDNRRGLEERLGDEGRGSGKGTDQLKGSAVLVDSLRSSLLDELPEEIRLQISNFGERASLEETRDIILLLCSRRFYKASELGILLKRDAVNLLATHLSPLRKEQKLKWLYPNSPSHPNQAYGTL